MPFLTQVMTLMRFEPITNDFVMQKACKIETLDLCNGKQCYVTTQIDIEKNYFKDRPQRTNCQIMFTDKVLADDNGFSVVCV